MRIRVVSDLHFEYQVDEGYTITQELATGNFKVLIVAGDLSDSTHLYQSVTMLAAAIHPKPLVYVFGNHEAFGSTMKEAVDIVESAARQCKNIRWLENKATLIKGQRFLGCTLWYRHPEKLVTDPNFVDFTHIRDIDTWIDRKSRESAAWLQTELKPGDIVVTHHLPHPNSVAPQFRGAVTNSYFLHDLSNLVKLGEAKLWVHGHTHSTFDYMVGKTRVVCNPFGYIWQLNKRFDPARDLTV